MAELSPSSNLSHYRIVSKIGAGGMGEVYLAEDTKLDRKVALKILPVEVASNRDRMQRFVREAKLAAALNHPNIAHVYEIGESNGTHFIAMEFIDGQTLRDLIHGAQADLRKLLRYLQQVAEGLAKAHAAGIVHRDLKPENIIIARDGYAKILDFGLSKLIEPQESFGSADPSFSENVTAMLPRHSTPGTVMGTVGYMSPEQAQGRVREIDHRSDIFSFGCILFEAITRRRAFQGKDAIDSLHKIVHGQTPELPEFDFPIPDELQRIVRRCLAKDRERRFQNIKDVAIELEEVQHELRMADLDSSVDSVGPSFARSLSRPSRASGLMSSAAPTASAPERPRSAAVATLLKVAIAAACLVLLIGIGVTVFQITGGVPWLKRSSPARTSRSPGGLNMKLLTATGRVQKLAISPDGKFLAYAQNDGDHQSLWTKQIATNSNVQLVGPETRFYSHLTFSPDGNYVYYVARKGDEEAGSVYRIPTLGGASVKVLSRVYDSVSFSKDGKMVAFLRYDTKNSASSLLVANADGSNEQLLATRSGHEWFASRGAAWSPDATLVACGAGDDRQDRQMTIVIIDARTKSARNLTGQRWDGIGGAAWTNDGSAILFSASDRGSTTPRQIWEVSYPGGEARRVTSDLNSYADVSLTSDATALVAAQTETISTIWISSSADLNRPKQITNGRDDGAGGIAWTPDGRIAYISSASGNTEIWTMKSDGAEPKQLTYDARTKFGLAVSPDGKYIVFSADHEGVHLWRIDIDGSHPLQLTNGNYETKPRFAPDGQSIVYSSYTSGTLAIWRVSIDGGAATQLTGLRSSDPDVSPDGKLIACFHNDDQSKAHLVVLPFDGGEPVRMFALPQSVNFGVGPRWTPDGAGITYVDGRGSSTRLWLQALDGKPAQKLTDAQGAGIRWREWSGDGRRIAVVREAPRSDAVMISNFR